EKTCSQDYQRLHIYMTVEAAPPTAPAVTTGSQSRPKNDQPSSRPATPTPTPAHPAGTQPKPPPQSKSSSRTAVVPAIPLDPSTYVPGRVLVVIAADSMQTAEVIAQKLAKTYDLDLVRIERLESINAALVTYALRGSNDVAAKVAALLPQVMLAQPDFIYQTSTPTVGEEEEQNDTPSALEYGPKLIGADRLRGSVTGKGVKIALIDTGVDTSHPALMGKIAE